MIVSVQRDDFNPGPGAFQGSSIFDKCWDDERRASRMDRPQPEVDQVRGAISRQNMLLGNVKPIGNRMREPDGKFVRIDRDQIQ